MGMVTRVPLMRAQPVHDGTERRPGRHFQHVRGQRAVTGIERRGLFRACEKPVAVPES